MGADQSQLNNQMVNLLCKETGLPRREIIELYGAFQKIKSSNGTTYRLLLTVKDFKAAYATYYGEESAAFAELVYYATDVNRKGSVNLQDVIHMLSTLKAKQNLDVKALWVFRMVDHNDDGEISYNDALYAMTALYHLQSGYIPHENTTQPQNMTDILFWNVNTKSVGTMSRSAFTKACANSNTLQKLIDGTAKAVTKPLIVDSPMQNGPREIDTGCF